MKLWAHGSWPNLADGSLNLSVEPFPQVCVCASACVYFCLCNSSETKTPQSVLLTIQVYIRISMGSWKPDSSLGYWCWFSFFSEGLFCSSVLFCDAVHLPGAYCLLCLFETLSSSQPIAQWVKQLSSNSRVSGSIPNPSMC